jgi:hypothetical protein
MFVDLVQKESAEVFEEEQHANAGIVTELSLQLFSRVAEERRM